MKSPNGEGILSVLNREAIAEETDADLTLLHCQRAAAGTAQMPPGLNYDVSLIRAEAEAAALTPFAPHPARGRDVIRQVHCPVLVIPLSRRAAVRAAS